MTYRLDDAQLSRVFPFHLVLDPDLRIVSHGPSLGKIDPVLQDQPNFGDHFRIRTPRIEPDFEILREMACGSTGNAGRPSLRLIGGDLADRVREPQRSSESETLYVLDHMTTGLSFRMQMVASDDPTRLVFIGSPLLTTPEQLDHYALTISDFAPFDFSLDYLLALRLKDSLIEETTRLTEELERTNQDLQEQVKARNAADQAKDLFLMTMSHEIRTPMNAITGLTSLLLQMDAKTARRQHLNTIETAARTLQTLIDGVLDFTKIESGAFEHCNEDFDLLDLIDQAARLFGPAAKEKGIELRYEFCDTTPRAVSGDMSQFNRVVSNLIHNAIKFTEAGRIEISVSARPDSEHTTMVRTEITDTGIGIAPEDHQRVFDRFTQVGDRATYGAGGSGLGLAISRKICEARGGGIGVDSTPGEGSRFWFEFPLRVRSHRATARTQTTQTLQKQSTKAQIETSLPVLVVDDNAINRNMIVDMLEWLGVETEAVVDGTAALERTTDRRFGAILMDVRMPGLDGYETARRIRNRGGPEADTPIIGLSANAFQRDREAGFAAGMDDYLAKPITIDSLVKILRRWPQTGYSIGSSNNAPPGNKEATSTLRRLSPEASNLVASSPLMEAGDDSSVGEYLDDFVTAAPEMIAAMERSLDSESFDEVSRLAHNLKGNSLFLGIEPLAVTAHRLERAADQCDPSEAASALTQIRAEIDHVLSILQAPASPPSNESSAETR
ncbi:MAG: ATP-binding protein [Myxococcota bacterium]|nr:ATP-binding protein [Myxococcota bacterium]